jgi:SAM-dependent methyltransferase
MSKLSERMVRDGHLGGYIPGGDPGTWCPTLWTWAVRRFEARSVLDVGCGEGHSARFFQQLGCDVLGVEGCSTAIENTAIPGNVVQHDFISGPFVPPRPFDLVWACEFLEHVDRRFVPNILATFAHAARAILVTHAFPSQDSGFHHVNCRPSSYWIRLIEGIGFKCHVPLTLEARTVTLQDYRGTNHFARSGLVFVPAEKHGGGWWHGLRQAVRARLVSWKLNWGFSWSRVYRAHKRRRRLEGKKAGLK